MGFLSIPFLLKHTVAQTSVDLPDLRKAKSVCLALLEVPEVSTRGGKRVKLMIDGSKQKSGLGKLTS